MEAGTVKFFKVNEHGGFGFIELPSGEQLYFQRNDGGPVIAGPEKPEIHTWEKVREPKKGDFINFERSSNRQGPKAAPWCFHEEWNLALVEIASRPVYRLMHQKGCRVLGNSKPQPIWQGSYLLNVSRMFPYREDLPLTTQHNGERWFVYWFERKTADEQWVRLDGDPRVDPDTVQGVPVENSGPLVRC